MFFCKMTFKILLRFAPTSYQMKKYKTKQHIAGEWNQGARNQTDQLQRPNNRQATVHTNLSSVVTRSPKEATQHLLRSENNVGQTMWPLGPRIVVVHDLPLFVVDLLALLVAHQKDDAAKEEDGRSPAYSVRPAELPYGPIACHGQK